MRHARYSLEEQVGGLVAEERYELRRPAVPEPEVDADAEPIRPVAPPQRPLTIRATRVDGTSASHAA
jgi:hypothetical protein